MVRVFTYLRVSTASQVAGDGFPRQREACHKFAESKGWTVMRDFKEQQSGSDEFKERAQLTQAIELCGTATGVKIIIIERADRLARDLIVSELFFRECRTRAILVYAADSGEELVNAESDPTRTLIRQVLGALSQWEKSMLVKKLQAGRRRTKEATGLPCGGRRPYGFRPTEWAGLRMILRLNRSGVSASVIAARMRKASRFHPDKFPLPDAPRRTATQSKLGCWQPATITKLINFWTPRLNYERNVLGREVPGWVHKKPGTNQ